MPCVVVPVVTAELSTAPSVTPMHGVHPLAKPIPSKKPPATPPLDGARSITRYSRSRKGIRITPATCSANTMTTSPATTGTKARTGWIASEKT